MAESSKRTNAWPHPASFPVGSDESRAAARAMLKIRDRVDLQIVIDHENPEGKTHSYRCMSDGKSVEIVIVGEIER